ncbi:MAG: hypothetical protein GWP08_06435 [Nitrospiraceae bacterium]|nr:hypothetical protein [Nitrospiraceae bacterium]
MRHFELLLACLMLSGLAMADNYWAFTAAGKTAPPTIDGQLGKGEYPADALEINAARVGDTAVHVRCVWSEYVDDADWSARVHAAWDAAYLYLLFEVTDDTVDFRAASETNWDVPTKDSFQFGLDVLGAPKGAKEARAHCSFLYLSGGDSAKADPVSSPQIFAHGDWANHSRVASQVELGSSLTDAGYNVEVAVPWKALAVAGRSFEPTAGERVGFYPIFWDGDGATPPAHEGVFVADDAPEGWNGVDDPPNWVDLTLAAPVGGGAVGDPGNLSTAKPLTGGVLLPYEILSLEGANWKGDAYTWGGLDGRAPRDSDQSALSVNGVGQSQELAVTLTRDFSGYDVRCTIGVRRNMNMAAKGTVYWDGKALAECFPWQTAEDLDSPEVITLAKSCFDFSPGPHTLRIEIDAVTEESGRNFQVDAIQLEGLPVAYDGRVVSLEDLGLTVVDDTPIVGEAVRVFQGRLTELGGGPLMRVDDGAAIVVAVDGAGVPLPKSVSDALADARATWEPFQREDGFVLALDTADDQTRIYAVGLGARGVVYALAELELRLRIAGQGLALAFPEWAPDATQGVLAEKPAFSMRGEYINIGYNFPGITPHTWDAAQWEAYIDQLVRAKLNRFMFYIWIDTYTMYPGSKLSRKPLNRQIHERVREAIRYAHRRGIKVSYHICPTFFPKDIWDAHPEFHAEIEYVEHGFPAVCPRSPGCWELMKTIWRSEMEWFSEADTIQIWFYDPGGCWCEKHGCKEHQTESIVRQAKEFAGLFLELNPAADVECNLWPMWLWEELKKIKYKRAVCRGLREAFGDDASKLRIVGAPDADVTLPFDGRAEGLDTAVFIFGTNPEAGYVFTVPTLAFCKHWINDMYAKGFNAAFGHRLEVYTRYPGTFAMGQYFWDPSLEPETVAHRFGAWQAANTQLGLSMAELLLLLDEFTEQGADAALGARMKALATTVFPALPKATQETLAYWPAMFAALDILAQSTEVPDGPALQLMADAFGAALADSPLLESIRSRARGVFGNYRDMLGRGQKGGRF